MQRCNVECWREAWRCSEKHVWWGTPGGNPRRRATGKSVRNSESRRLGSAASRPLSLRGTQRPHRQKQLTRRQPASAEASSSGELSAERRLGGAGSSCAEARGENEGQRTRGGEGTGSGTPRPELWLEEKAVEWEPVFSSQQWTLVRWWEGAC